MNESHLRKARLFFVLAAIVIVVWLLCGCVTYHRHVWTPDDLRDGEVRIINSEPDRLTVTEGYVYWLSRSYSEARFLSLLIRENEDGTWVIRREK